MLLTSRSSLASARIETFVAQVGAISFSISSRSSLASARIETRPNF